MEDFLNPNEHGQARDLCLRANSYQQSTTRGRSSLSKLFDLSQDQEEPGEPALLGYVKVVMPISLCAPHFSLWCRAMPMEIGNDKPGTGGRKKIRQ